jgi:hypothetical protein
VVAHDLGDDLSQLEPTGELDGRTTSRREPAFDGLPPPDQFETEVGDVVGRHAAMLATLHRGSIRVTTLNFR